MKPSPQRIWKYNQVVYAECLDELDKHFKALNVRYMPIKGAYLICSGLAEKMPYRRIDDIDILVKLEDFDRVCDYFSNLPQVKILKQTWYFEKEFAYSIGSFQCYFEIHWLLNYPARFNLPTENLFERALPAEGMRLLPCPEDALIILLCRTLVHIAYEIRETLFEEISLISNQKGFSWHKFWDLTKTTGIMSFFCFILSWYKKEANDIKIIVPKKHGYAHLMAKILGTKRYARMPFLWKRLFLELLFVKSPLLLIKNKLFKEKECL